MEPDPIVVAAKLLERKKYVDSGKQLNIIACSWIQFMIHDWNDHMEDTDQQVYTLYLRLLLSIAKIDMDSTKVMYYT